MNIQLSVVAVLHTELSTRYLVRSSYSEPPGLGVAEHFSLKALDLSLSSSLSFRCHVNNVNRL